MAKASRNTRRKARIKRTNSLLKRQLRLLSTEAHKSYVYLMAILAQRGGEVTITKGTVQQTLEHIQTLGYQIIAGEAEQDLIIRQVVHGGLEQSNALEGENNAVIEEVSAGSESEFDPPYLGGGIAGDGGGPAPVDPALG